MRGNHTAKLAHKWQLGVVSSLKLNSISFFGISFGFFTMHLIAAGKLVLALVSADWGRVLAHLLIQNH